MIMTGAKSASQLPNVTHSCTDMDQVILRTVITLNGTDFTVNRCDYTQTINDLIEDGLIEENNNEIIDFVIEDYEEP